MLPELSPEILRGICADLERLAASQLGPRLREKIEPADVVQQALLQACEKFDQFQGSRPEEFVAWLRAIQNSHVHWLVRYYRQKKRDPRLEQSLQGSLAASSLRLGDFLAADQSSPSHRAWRAEEVLRLAAMLAALPERARQALHLKYWQGCSLAAIARRLDCTRGAVVGLLQRGLGQLRKALCDKE
jgi:RNA polymerase sigma-70 factor (ECF subfamily)